VERISGKEILNYTEFNSVVKEYHIADRLSIAWLLKHPMRYSDWLLLRKLVNDANARITLSIRCSYLWHNQSPLAPQSQTDTMNRYYGDLCRNIDSAFILCGIEQEDGLCLGKIAECPFRHELFGQRICRLTTFMALVAKDDKSH
jgi:hypothetical protein